MDRATFLKSLAALAAAGAVPGTWAQPGANLKVLIPASPGGGWDTTGRALGQAMLDAKQAAAVTYENKGGAAGVLGMGPFIARDKGDATQIMVMGAVMLGGLIASRWPINLMRGTPLMRLTKAQTWDLAHDLGGQGLVDVIVEHSHTSGAPDQ